MEKHEQFVVAVKPYSVLTRKQVYGSRREHRGVLVWRFMARHYGILNTLKFAREVNCEGNSSIMNKDGEQ